MIGAAINKLTDSFDICISHVKLTWLDARESFAYLRNSIPSIHYFKYDKYDDISYEADIASLLLSTATFGLEGKLIEMAKLDAALYFWQTGSMIGYVSFVPRSFGSRFNSQYPSNTPFCRSNLTSFRRCLSEMSTRVLSIRRRAHLVLSSTEEVITSLYM